MVIGASPDRFVSAGKHAAASLSYNQQRSRASISDEPSGQHPMAGQALIGFHYSLTRLARQGPFAAHNQQTSYSGPCQRPDGEKHEMDPAFTRHAHTRVTRSLIAVVAALSFQLVPTVAGATPQETAPTAASLAGTWSSAPDEMKLTTDFDRSVWGAGATSIRTVALVVQASGNARLTVTRKVNDAKGRTVTGSQSVEEAELVVGAPRERTADRVEYEVKVTKAERRYPGDAAARWPLEGLGVKLYSLNAGTLEVRFDTPEGTGSFWETLRRGAATTSKSPASATTPKTPASSATSKSPAKKP